jgi:predicted permease
VVTLLAGNYFPPSGEAGNLIARASSLMLPLLILLIPCTNVSALLVGLAVARRREIAVRLSLGAARRRIIRQLLTESVVLALAAGALGLMVIVVLMKVFEARVPDVQLVLHWPVFAYTSGIAIVTGVLFGVSPASHATRVSIADVLKNSSNATSSRSRLQSGLVVAQIAMTQPLLLGLGALILSQVTDLQRLPAPLFADRIVQVSFNTNPRYGAMDVDREEILRRLQDRIAALPGVVAVVAQGSDNRALRVAVHPSDRVGGLEVQELWVGTHPAPPGYFEMMGFPLVRGRGFGRADRDGSQAVVIRGDLARRLWGSADPIGRRLISIDGAAASTPFVVVGVVDERRAGLGGDGLQQVFVPNVTRTGSLLVRTQGPALPVIPVIRSVASAHAPLLPITSASTLAAIDAGQRSFFRRVITGVAATGVVALLLCAIGLYAVVAFAVGQHTREIGIRTAMGAGPGQVISMFFFKGLRMSFLGLLIGLAISAIVVRMIALSQGEEAPANMFLLAGVIASVVVAVAAAATWIPARRAARVDPLNMLRAD